MLHPTYPFRHYSQCTIPSTALDFVEVKYGWASASLAVILRSGSYKSNLLIKCHPSLHNTLVAYKKHIHWYNHGNLEGLCVT